MLNFAKLEETVALPLKAIWAAKNGISAEAHRHYTANLLTDIDCLPQLGCKTAIILGSTNATAFIVDAAVKAGHTQFVLLGGKKLGKEHPAFTDYVRPRLQDGQIKYAADQNQTEAEYAEKLLLKYGVSRQSIARFDDDRSTHTGANMQLLKAHGFDKVSALEFYALAGSARRALMTARKEFGNAQVMSAHNAYPTGVTRQNWSEEPVARAHIVGEAVKSLGANPLYVRRGFAVPVNLAEETSRGIRFLNSGPGKRMKLTP